MPEEVWALVGVVVGALLGGAAQVVANVIADRGKTRDWRRDKRAEAYVRYMALWMEVQGRVDATVAALEGGSPYAHGEPITYGEVRALLQEVRAPISLYGSPEVSRLAGRPIGHLQHAALQTDRDAGLAALHRAAEAYQAFQTAARKELGFEVSARDLSDGG